MSVSSSAAYIFLLMQTFQMREEKLCKDNFFLLIFFFLSVPTGYFFFMFIYLAKGADLIVANYFPGRARR